MEKFYCLKCMRERPQEEKICPSCGNAHGVENQPPHAMSCASILSGRYLVGLVLSEDDLCISYKAMDLYMDKAVILKELFPLHHAERMNGIIRWSGDSNEQMTIVQQFQNQMKGIPEAELFAENGTVYAVLACAQPAPVKNILLHGRNQDTPVSPKIPEIRKQTQPQKSKTPLIGLAVAGAAAVVLVLSWCGFHHIRGGQFMKQENHYAAAAAYEKDFLFSYGNRPEARRLAGEDAFAEEDYAAAVAYFEKMGEEGQIRWADSVYEQARQLISKGESEEAITLLESIAGEERAAAQTGVAQLQIAQRMYDEGDTTGALELAESIQNRTEADVEGFLNHGYCETAQLCLDSDNLPGAISNYQKCSNSAIADRNGAVLEKLRAEEYYEAAVLMHEALDADETDLSEEKWRTVFEANMKDLSAIYDRDQRIRYAAAKGLLEDEIDFDADSTLEAFKTYYDSVDGIGGYSYDTDYIESLQDLFAECGAEADGKILLVIQKHAFPDRAASQKLDLSATELLPAQYRPASLAEVGYVVVVNYDYTRTGSYTKGTIAVRENAKVEVYKMPGKNRTSATTPVYGPAAPNSISYYFKPDYWSAGTPSMGEQVYTALKKLMK